MNELLTSVKKMVSQMEPYDVADFYQNNRFPSNHWLGIMENIIAPLEIESMEELDGLAIVQTLEAIGYASTDGGLNFAVGAHTLASAIPILKYGSAAQNQHLLNPMLTGKLICANAITETEAGSDRPPRKPAWPATKEPRG